MSYVLVISPHESLFILIELDDFLAAVIFQKNEF